MIVLIIETEVKKTTFIVVTWVRSLTVENIFWTNKGQLNKKSEAAKN